MIGSVAVFLYLSAAFQGVVLAAVILGRGRREAAEQVLLGVLVLAFSLYLAEFAAYWTPFYVSVPHLLFATVTFPLLFGPLIYGLVVKATGGPAPTWRSLPHLIPFVLYLGRLAPFYLAPAEFKREYYLTVIFTSDPQWPLGTYVIFAAILVHLGAYLTASWRRLRRWDAGSGRANPVAYRLLSRFLAAWSVILVLRLVNLLEVIFLGYRYIAVVDNALLLASSLLIYASVYMMLGSGYQSLFGALRPPPEKYARSALAPGRLAGIAERVQEVMEREQLFLDPDLRLGTLARRLGVSRYHLSQSLNQQLGKTFNEFVNEYRIRALKDRMADPETERLSILQLAMDAGFGTKATFNSAFKKATGLTPSQYRARRPAER